MESMKKYPSAIRDNVYEWTKDVRDVNILVGIPCYNNEDTISHVISTAAEGLRRYYTILPLRISRGAETEKDLLTSWCRFISAGRRHIVMKLRN